jgi:heme/copper-type cytochrome/quinol oxidase subunit 2
MEDYQGQGVLPVPQNERVMSVKDWLITSLILCIPLVGIIMLFVWAFGGDVNKNKQNYAKASLIFVAIAFVVYILIAIVFVSIFAAAFSNSGY